MDSLRKQYWDQDTKTIRQNARQIFRGNTLKAEETARRDMTVVKYTARYWTGSCTEGNFPVNYHLTTGEA